MENTSATPMNDQDFAEFQATVDGTAASYRNLPDGSTIVTCADGAQILVRPDGSSAPASDQVGIRAENEDGEVLGTLWQHLSAEECEATLEYDGIGALSDWSGTWEPARPVITGKCVYEIVRR